MHNQKHTNYHQEDEITLIELIKILFASKKLILLITLVFTIASILYSFFLQPSFSSSAKLEIGYIDMPNGKIEIIEPSSQLISDLKVLMMKNLDSKFNNELIFKAFEEKIINFSTTSKSLNQNENILNELIRYSIERHNNLAKVTTDQKKDQIHHQIDLIESKRSFLKESLRVDLESKISKLKSNLPLLDQEIGQLNQVILEDSNNLKLLKGATLSAERAANSPTLEQIISGYKSQIAKLSRERNFSILDISILSQKLDALKNATLQSDELFNLDQSQKTFENELKLLNSQVLIKTNLIGNITTKTIRPKNLLLITLGVIFGLFVSIIVVLFTNSLKTSKKD
jgi:LPS O-antigen subunit length determinant protein (WzzB/FepE family)